MVLKPLFAASFAFVVAAASPTRSSAMDDHQHGSHGQAQAAAPAATSTPAPKDAQVVELTVTSKGFEPAVITVKSGTPVKLVVTRKTERTCATEIVMKDFGVNQPLPLEKPVTVVVTPKGPGQYRYACGMNMIAGTLKVQ
jgi:plastocyanin domain-containing protein